MARTRLVHISNIIRGSFVTMILIGASGASVSASTLNDIAIAEPVGQRRIVVADAHEYRHCHNLRRRTYCHKKGRLPQNWPPNSNTPHREGDDARKERCPQGSVRCEEKSDDRRR